MSADIPVYELYAIRYATREASRSSHFMGGDAHDGPMPMDYFIWVAIHDQNAIVIDLGFTDESAKKRNRSFICDPIQSLRLLNIDPEKITDAILTHLHYDHAGNLDGLPSANFHIQEPEMHFVSGRHMKYKYFSSGYEVKDITRAISLNFEGRLVFHNGESEIKPGIRVIPVPGHSPGQQAVLVHTQRGWVVIASDAAHYYENLQRYRPYPAAVHIDKVLESFDKLMFLGKDIEHIIPGHDPIVMQIYPSAKEGLEGKIVRLDMQPSQMPQRVKK